MPDNELERLISDFAALGRKIHAMGKEAGKEAERARVMAMLQSPGEEAPMRDQMRRKPREHWATYGSVSAPIREALMELSADSPTGATVADLVAFFELRGTGPTQKQIRAALKNLSAPGGEIVRVDRGKYLSRDAYESRRAGKSGADTPDRFNQAAE